MFKHFIFILVGAGLVACSSVNTITVQSDTQAVVETSSELNRIDSIVMPYKSELEAEMLEEIAKAEKNFERGRPNGALNNWSTDAVQHFFKSQTEGDIVGFVLLNFGGLRNTINQGSVSLGDIFKVMPFDNEVVFVEMPISTREEIASYLIDRGGEPIGGATIDNGQLNFVGFEDDSETFWIATSDYLMNGGDNMTFFEKKVSVVRPGVLLRDVFIEAAKRQGTLEWSDEERIKL